MKPILFICLLSLMISKSMVGQLDIIVDYRYDQGYFSNNPERKAVLEHVVGLWEKVITTEALIPAGTEVTRRIDYTKPETEKLVWEEDLKAFVLFVYCYDFALEVDENGNPNPGTSKAVGGRLSNGKFQGFLALNTKANRPWFFDSSPETTFDIPISTHYDFITTATHEIGHALGFLLSYMQPFITKTKDGVFFTGEKAKEWNFGEPIPLEKNSSHIRGSFANDHYLPCPPIDRFIMQTHDPVQGYRQLMTPIDLAILEDIGWSVNYDNLPLYPYTPNPDPRRNNLTTFGINDNTLNPVGLWRFDMENYLSDAIIGKPLRYSPAPGSQKEIDDLFVDGDACIQVPKSGFLYCSHDLLNYGDGESKIEDYSIIFDVKIDQLGHYYSLFNADYGNASDGETFINKDGKVGIDGQYSPQILTPNKWHRIGINVNYLTGTLQYFIDGAFSHELTDIRNSERFKLNSKESGKGLIALFADNNGEDQNIKVKGIAIYYQALTKAEMHKLGTANQLEFGL